MRGGLIASLFLSQLVLSAGAATADSDGKHKITLNISTDPQRRVEDLKALRNFDIMGVDGKNGRVQIYADSREIQKITTMGFPINFADLEFEGTTAQPTLQKYLNPTDVITRLNAIHAQFPNQTLLSEIGKTRRGRPIVAIEISSNLNDPSRPAILFNGMHHAREVMTTEVTMHMVEVLLAKYNSDPETKHWLDSYRIFVVPQVNPDGNDIVHTAQPMWRKNAFSANGKVVGVDLNRNYPELWGYCNGSSANPGDETYRGPAAGSEPETQAMMNFVKAIHPVFNISYHSYSEMILFPFGCSAVPNGSKELFKTVGAEIRAGTIDDNGRPNTYELGTPPELLYQADGSDIDWQWKNAGVMSFVMEINSMNLGFQPSYDKWREVTVARQEGGWKALLRRMDKGGVRGFVRSNTDAAQLSYTIAVPARNGAVSWTADRYVAPFKLRNASGLFFQVLDPGTYLFTFYRNNQPIKTQSIVVGNKMVNLGALSL